MNKKILKTESSNKEGAANVAKLPLLVKAVLVLTTLACVSNVFLEDVPISGLAWFIPLLLSLFFLFRAPGSIKFPYQIWIPWILYVVFYMLTAEAEHSAQRSIMLICPIFIGMAVSALKIDDNDFRAFRKAYQYMAMVFVIFVVLKTGVLLTGALPEATGLAAEVMTSSLLCCIFAANYAVGRQRDILWWSVLAVIPVIAVTRMGILATGVSLPFTMAPLKLAKRMLLIGIMLIVGLAVFNTERVQQKTFHGGSGTIQEVRLDNPNLATSGRKTMWDALEYEIDKEPWFGHGANAIEPFLIRLTGFLSHPHNDWLRLQYDYGRIGTALFAVTMVFQMISAFRSARTSSGDTRLFFYVGVSSFIIFSLFMFTDNIVLYAAFFGNLQFTILGMAYASHEDHFVKAEKKHKVRVTW